MKCRTGRRTVKLYHQWIVNGYRCEIASVMEFLDVAAQTARVLGVTEGVLIFSYDMKSHREQVMRAVLELSTPQIVGQYVEAGRVCAVKQLC